MNLLLRNLKWHNGVELATGDIRIKGGVIHDIAANLAPAKDDQTLTFDNHFLYPGLINSHDHLAMNLYPHLGNPPYTNYVAWGEDIHRANGLLISEIQKADIVDRLWWGGIKNLISGATTVVHHDPWHRALDKSDFPVKVLKKMIWVHSLTVGKNIQKAYLEKKEYPFVIHAAEGIDFLAEQEICALEKLNILSDRTALIHAVALTEEAINIIDKTNCSIVWCPSSNFFMFNRTCPIAKLKPSTRISLGSDSTLTGSPTLLHEMHVALKEGNISSEKIFNMVTKIPASTFNLHIPQIAESNPADFFIAPSYDDNYFHNLKNIYPENIALVVVNGRVELSDDTMKFKEVKFSVKIGGAPKRMRIDISALKRRISKSTRSTNLSKNPLWNLVEPH